MTDLDAALARIASLEAALQQARDFVWHVQQTNLGIPRACDGTCDLARWTDDAARSALEASAVPTERCIFEGCVATWEHYHGGFPGGYQDPAFPDGEGVPIRFTGPNPDPTAVRDYNGAVVGYPARATEAGTET